MTDISNSAFQRTGHSKRDNLNPSLVSKYHVNQEVIAVPFRSMDFGCFATTEDGLSGLIHISEMPLSFRQRIEDKIANKEEVQVVIAKYDRRTGEVGFKLATKENPASVLQTANSTEHRDLPPLHETSSCTPTASTKTLDHRLDQETADIQKFLETVIKSPLSPAAKQKLRAQLQNNSVFRYTYTMQTVVDEFEPDPGLQLLSQIEALLTQPDPDKVGPAN